MAWQRKYDCGLQLSGSLPGQSCNYGSALMSDTEGSIDEAGTVALHIPAWRCNRSPTSLTPHYCVQQSLEREQSASARAQGSKSQAGKSSRARLPSAVSKQDPVLVTGCKPEYAAWLHTHQLS